MSRLFVLDDRQLQTFKKLAVIGDLHGDYDALKSALSIVNPIKDGIIFLGDYADRGPYGVEVIDAVDSLMRNHSRNVFALKGNHEDYTEFGEPAFCPASLTKEASKKRGDWQKYFTSTFKPFVKSLLLAVIIPGETLFVHGGISSKIKSLKDLENPASDIEEDVLWSDPTEVQGEDLNSRGFGVAFGPDISKNVCQKVGIKRIIRSHEPSRVAKAGGPCYSHDCRVLTTSTTTSYKDPRYKPFILSISPADFSIKCLRIDADPPIESEIVSCKSQC